jgi:hypothetical protein
MGSAVPRIKAGVGATVQAVGRLAGLSVRLAFRGHTMRSSHLLPVILLSTLCGPVRAQTQNPRPDGLTIFVASNYYSNKIAEALKTLPPDIVKLCRVYVYINFPLKIIKKVNFSSSGLPNSGLWEQDLLISGCGSQVMLRASTSATPDKEVSISIHSTGPPEAQR